MFYTCLQVICGTGFTFLMTTLGAAVVFCFRGAIGERMNRGFLGFASGVMMAAAVWSLLIPSIEQSGELGMLPWLPPAVGFTMGGVFLYLIDRTLPWFHADYKEKEAGTKLLVLAVTVHNIPEGMAVGLAFVLAGQYPKEPGYLAAAIGLLIACTPEWGKSVSSVFDRMSFWYSGASGRNFGVSHGLYGSSFDALALGICSRSNDLCSGG